MISLSTVCAATKENQLPRKQPSTFLEVELGRFPTNNVLASLSGLSSLDLFKGKLLFLLVCKIVSSLTLKMDKNFNYRTKNYIIPFSIELSSKSTEVSYKNPKLKHSPNPNHNPNPYDNALF